MINCLQWCIQSGFIAARWILSLDLDCLNSLSVGLASFCNFGDCHASQSTLAGRYELKQKSLTLGYCVVFIQAIIRGRNELTVSVILYTLSKTSN